LPVLSWMFLKMLEIRCAVLIGAKRPASEGGRYKTRE